MIEDMRIASWSEELLERDVGVKMWTGSWLDPVADVCGDGSQVRNVGLRHVNGFTVRIHLCATECPEFRLDILFIPFVLNQPPNSMEQSSSWEANSHSASREIHRTLQNILSICHQSHPCYMPRPSRLSWSDHLVKRTSYEAPPYAVFSSFPPLPYIPLITLFSYIHDPCSSLSVRDQVSHPCKTTTPFVTRKQGVT